MSFFLVLVFTAVSNQQSALPSFRQSVCLSVLPSGVAPQLAEGEAKCKWPPGLLMSAINRLLIFECDTAVKLCPWRGGRKDRTAWSDTAPPPPVCSRALIWTLSQAAHQPHFFFYLFLFFSSHSCTSDANQNSGWKVCLKPNGRFLHKPGKNRLNTVMEKVDEHRKRSHAKRTDGSLIAGAQAVLNWPVAESPNGDTEKNSCSVSAA